MNTEKRKKLVQKTYNEVMALRIGGKHKEAAEKTWRFLGKMLADENFDSPDVMIFWLGRWTAIDLD